VEELWRWREGIGIAADGWIGGKVSEDIAVPVDRLEEAIAGTHEIGRRYGLEACSWGHAGDGNLHSTFMMDRSDPSAVAKAEGAGRELFDLAARLGGTISGEHGIGIVKSGHLSKAWAPDAVRLHKGIKDLFDPQGLLNPGKKAA
jgi:FAD/FMN-containing dehydrogenase